MRPGASTADDSGGSKPPAERRQREMTQNVADLLARVRRRSSRGCRAHRARRAGQAAIPPRDPAQVYSLRMAVNRLAQRRQAAEQAGVSPSTLMRTWVLERLDAENPAILELLRSLVRDEVSRQAGSPGTPSKQSPHRGWMTSPRIPLELRRCSAHVSQGLECAPVPPPLSR